MHADSVQKRYQSGYDSIIARYEARTKAEKAQLQLYKTSVRALAKYQQSAGGASLAAPYATMRGEYGSAMNQYAQHLAEYEGAVRDHAEIFAALRKLYKRQDKLALYMEQAEKQRKALEQKTLERQDAFNKKENAQQLKVVDESMKRTRRLARKSV